MTDAAGDVATVTVAGRSTTVKVIPLWEIDAPAFRERVAHVFRSVWPDRRGECVAIRRGAHTPERKPTPLVLVPADAAEGETPEVLGYTIVYPSSAVRRPPSGENRRPPSGEACANCTLNSVLVPAELRGRGVGAALVKLAARRAMRSSTRRARVRVRHRVVPAPPGAVLRKVRVRVRAAQARGARRDARGRALGETPRSRGRRGRRGWRRVLRRRRRVGRVHALICSSRQI